MHQIRFPLGFRSRPHRGSLQRSPDHLAVFKGPTSKGREREEKERKRRERRGVKKRREDVANSWLRHWPNVLERANKMKPAK